MDGASAPLPSTLSCLRPRPRSSRPSSRSAAAFTTGEQRQASPRPPSLNVFVEVSRASPKSRSPTLRCRSTCCCGRSTRSAPGRAMSLRRSRSGPSLRPERCAPAGPWRCVLGPPQLDDGDVPRGLVAASACSRWIHAGRRWTTAGTCAIFFSNIAAMTWSGRFDLDFMAFLGLSGVLVASHHRFSGRAIALGLVAYFGGMMFFTPTCGGRRPAATAACTASQGHPHALDRLGRSRRWQRGHRARSPDNNNKQLIEIETSGLDVRPARIFKDDLLSTNPE